MTTWRTPAGDQPAGAQSDAGNIRTTSLTNLGQPAPFGSAARALLAAGWSPIPLPAGAKFPPPAGFTGAAGVDVTADQLDAWLSDGWGGGNVAVRVPDHVIGLDVDAYDGHGGGKTLAGLEGRLGPLPAVARLTSRASTDRVSGIRFYRVPAGRRWVSGLPGIEIVQYAHRYAVTAPSLHPSGRVYRWADDPVTGGSGLPDGQVPAVDELPELPDAWVRDLDLGPRGDRRLASPQQVAELTEAMPDGDPCPAVQRRLDQLTDALQDAAGGLHDQMTRHVMALVRLGEQGHRGVPDALAEAQRQFLAALASGRDRSRARGAVAEFDRAVTGAVRKVAAEPTDEEHRRCCGTGNDSIEWDDDEDGALVIDLSTGEVLADNRVTAGGVDVDVAGTESSSDDDAEDPELAFWQSRPILTALRDFARARRVAPWSVFGSVLARAVASVSPSVVLPPTIGSHASLNLFVALCGVSGGGKTASASAATDFLSVRGGIDYLETAPGSGEGLISAYGFTKTEKGQRPTFVITRASVLFTVDEVQSIDALAARTASTLTAFLKTAAMGKRLATQNADPTRVRNLPDHSYRLAITAGVQPANAGMILGDSAGGFPQRWLWMPTYDPDMPDRRQRIPEPRPWNWRVPVEQVHIEDDGTIVFPADRTVLQLPDVAVEAILDAHYARNRPMDAPAGLGADLDGHAVLTRTKVAAVLALLDERGHQVTAEDWELAGTVMAVSDRTRDQIIALNAREARVEADHKAARVGRSAAIARDAETETRVVRSMGTIRRKLDRAAGAEVSGGQLRKALASNNRDLFQEAADRLVESGEVIAEEREVTGATVVFYRLRGKQ